MRRGSVAPWGSRTPFPQHCPEAHVTLMGWVGLRTQPRYRGPTSDRSGWFPNPTVCTRSLVRLLGGPGRFKLRFRGGPGGSSRPWLEFPRRLGEARVKPALAMLLSRAWHPGPHVPVQASGPSLPLAPEVRMVRCPLSW